MPKRTNDFQQLVLMIQQALVPEGAVVTESAMVGTTDGTTTREIDILIQSLVGPYTIRIAVEAKDESRKMDLTGFEAIIAKYLVDGGVNVNKVVVVAHSGFSESVKTRAKLLDVDLFTLSEAGTVDWTRLKPPEPCFRSAAEIIDIQCDEAARNSFGGTIPSDAYIACECGRYHGSLQQYARYAFWKMISERREELLRADNEVMSQGKERKAHITFQPAAPHLISIVHGDQRVPLTEFKFKVRLSPRIDPPPLVATKIQFAHAPHVCNVKFVPQIDAENTRQLLDEARVKCSCCNHDHGTVREWTSELALAKFLNRSAEAQRQLSQALDTSPNGNVQMNVTWPIPAKLRVHLGDMVYAPASVEVGIHAVSATGALEHTQYEICKPDGTKSRVDSFDGAVGGKRLRFVLPDGTGSKKVILRVGDANGIVKSPQRKKLEQQRKRIDARRKPRNDRRKE